MNVKFERNERLEITPTALYANKFIMSWKKIKRNDAGRLEEEIINELERLESNEVMFWNSDDDVAEIIDMACFIHIVDVNPAYTHYKLVYSPFAESHKTINNPKKIRK